MVVTAKEPSLKASQTLKKVQQVGSLTVTLRGKPVATLLSTNPLVDKPLKDYPAFGMWANRKDTKNVRAWLHKIRTPRHLR
jgi:antitoxin (DNA-binding transcriptional repressor) of toxin-antitoxin stability system